MHSCPACGQRLPDPPNPAQVIASEFPGLPVAEMLKRGWLGDDSTIDSPDDLRCRVQRFFSADSPEELRASLVPIHRNNQ